MKEVDGVRYKNLTEEQVKNLKTTARLGDTPELRSKAQDVLHAATITSKVQNPHHTIQSYKDASGGKAPQAEDIGLDMKIKKDVDLPSKKLNYLDKIVKGSKSLGKKLPMVGGIVSAIASGDMMAAVPVLGSADEVGRGSELIPPTDPAEREKFYKDKQLEFSRAIEESKKKKVEKPRNVFDMIKEKLK